MANLIIQTAFVGDLLLAIPLIKKTRQLFPNDKLVILCRAGLGSVLLDLNLVDEVIEFKKGDKKSWSLARRKLRSEKFEHVICPHQSFRSLLLCYQLKANHKVGFSNWWNSWVFDRAIQRPMQLPEALRQLSLLTTLDPEFAREFEGAANKFININEQSTVSKWSPSEIPEWASMSLRDQLNGPLPQQPWVKEFVAMAPGSVWATKRWTTEGYIAVAKALQAKGLGVVLIGAPDEKELCDQIAQTAPGVVNLTGQTSLIGTLCLLREAKALVANDSGAMHMGAVAGTPTIAIFGPTTLSLGYRPWNSCSIVVQNEHSCRPCGKHGSRSCPIGTHICMKSVTSQQVLAEVDSLISR